MLQGRHGAVWSGTDGRGRAGTGGGGRQQAERVEGAGGPPALDGLPFAAAGPNI